MSLEPGFFPQLREASAGEGGHSRTGCFSFKHLITEGSAIKTRSPLLFVETTYSELRSGTEAISHGLHGARAGLHLGNG